MSCPTPVTSLKDSIAALSKWSTSVSSASSESKIIAEGYMEDTEILDVPWLDYSSEEQDNFFTTISKIKPKPALCFNIRTALSEDKQVPFIKYLESIGSTSVPQPAFKCTKKHAAALFQILTKARVRQCLIVLDESWNSPEQISLPGKLFDKFIQINPQLERLHIAECDSLPKEVLNLPTIIRHGLNRIIFQGYETNPSIVKTALILMQLRPGLRVELEYDKMNWTAEEEHMYQRLCPPLEVAQSSAIEHSSHSAPPEPILISKTLQESALRHRMSTVPKAGTPIRNAV